MGLTPVLSLPYPELADTPDVPRDIQALAERLDALVGALNPQAQVPIGAIMAWMTATAPTHWLLCDGTDVDDTLYPALAAVLGSTAGMIRLPALAGRMPLGTDATHALKSTGGAETVPLAVANMPSHAHGGATGVRDRSQNHTHAFGPIINGGGPASVYGLTNLMSPSAGPIGQGGTVYAVDAPDHLHGIGPEGGGVAHANMPPYLTVNFVIRAE
jgi:microcystin-dependent protein